MNWHAQLHCTGNGKQLIDERVLGCTCTGWNNNKEIGMLLRDDGILISFDTIPQIS